MTWVFCYKLVKISTLSSVLAYLYRCIGTFSSHVEELLIELYIFSTGKDEEEDLNNIETKNPEDHFNVSFDYLWNFGILNTYFLVYQIHL